MFLHLLYIIIFVVDLLTASTIIFVERRNVAVTWAWLVVLLFIPIGGFVLYLILGQHINRFRIYKMKKRTRRMVDILINRQKYRLSEGMFEYADPSAKRYENIILMNLATSYSYFTQDNELQIYTSGREKFDALLRDIRSATDHIHMEYYTIRDDNLGRELIRALADRARDGVEVRFLYDAVGSAWTRGSLFRPLLESGGQVASFFPSRIPYLNFRMNHRNHRKLVIVDGRIGYIGGFNIGDEYLGLVERFGHWRDTHMRVLGSAALEMQAVFLLDWNSAYVQPVPDEHRYFPIRQNDGKIGMQIVSSGPNSTWEQIRQAYLRMIYAGKQSIYIQTPYFIPDESLLTALKTAALGGVDVRIMLPSKPDHRFVYWASKFYLGELLEVGVKCYLYDKGFLHAKTVVVDENVASVGTANIDIRSFKLNFEVNALIYDTKTAAHLARIFEEDLVDCTELTIVAYRHRPRSSKIAESCARLLSPIL